MTVRPIYCPTETAESGPDQRKIHVRLSRRPEIFNSQRPKFQLNMYVTAIYTNFVTFRIAFRKIIRKLFICITANFP